MSSDSDATGIPLQPLIKSLPAVWCVCAGLIFVAVLSAILFVYQFYDESEPGVRFVSVPGNAIYVYVHLVRASICGALAWALHRYIQRLKSARRGDSGSEEFVATCLARWWNLLAVSVLAALGFGVLSAIVLMRSTGPIEAFNDIETFQSLPNPEVRVAFRLAETQWRAGLAERIVQRTGETLWVQPESIISNEQIADASASVSQDGSPVVRLAFTPEGESRIRKATREHIGGRLAIEVDNRVVSAPVIEWIIGRAAVVDIGEDMENTIRLARALSGTPAPD